MPQPPHLLDLRGPARARCLLLGSIAALLATTRAYTYTKGQKLVGRMTIQEMIGESLSRNLHPSSPTSP